MKMCRYRFLPSLSLSTILDVNEVEIVSAVPWKKSINGTISNNFSIKCYDTKCLIPCIIIIYFLYLLMYSCQGSFTKT